MAINIKTPASDCTLAPVIEELARNAGNIALGHFHSLTTLPVQEKGHLDLVTQADTEVEEFLIANLRKVFPHDAIFGEEGGDVAGSTGRTWVIDPIDGTFNFVRGSHDWAISIGLYENHRPVFGVVYAPLYDRILSGGVFAESRMNGKPLQQLPRLDLSKASVEIGIHPSITTADRLEMVRYISDELHIAFRYCGAATIALIKVATGEVDGYLSLGDSTWDVIAGLAILGNLGASHTIDWAHTHPKDKLRYACGSEGFLEKIRPVLEKIGVPVRREQG